MPSKSFTLLCCTLFLFACKPQRSHKVSTAAYKWQTTWQQSEAEQKFCDSLDVKTLYVRAFDVVWEGQAVPQAVLQLVEKPSEAQAYVLCVFLTQSVFEHTPAEQTAPLAQKVLQKLATFQDKFPHTLGYQMDCDWTAKSRLSYFAFLEHLQRLKPAGLQLSATIRLHQIKFPKQTGIPPVERGSLMFYNMGDVSNVQTHNSILDVQEARKYVDKLSEYPLDLDVILPIFSWGCVYRNGSLVQLLPEFSPDSLKALQAEKGFYRVDKSQYHKGTYLYKDDQIRWERVNTQQLREAALLLAPLIRNDSLTLAFYHLSPASIRQFKAGELAKLRPLFMTP